MYSYTLNNSRGGNTLSRGVDSSLIRFGRVVNVVLSSADEDFELGGGDISIGGIRFRYLTTDQQENSTLSLPFAYKYESNFKTYPVKGEIVEIIQAPTEIIDQGSTIHKLYYRSIVNIWNVPNRNSYPDIYQLPDEREWIEENLIDQSEIRNLSPFPGDVIVEGRNGQSLRMSGNSHPLSIYSNNSNNGKPFTILRNGISSRGKTADTNLEDINLDDASLYLTSDHVIPLTPLFPNKKSYKNGTEPVNVDVYKGKQILLNSDRVVINSKEDSILISGKKSINLSAGTVNIEGGEYVGFESQQIYLGSEAINLPLGKKQPAVLGLENKKLMIEIINSLQEIATTLIQAPPSPAGLAASLKVLGTVLQAQIVEIQIQLEKINSKKIFIDSGK